MVLEPTKVVVEPAWQIDGLLLIPASFIKNKFYDFLSQTISTSKINSPIVENNLSVYENLFNEGDYL